MSIRRFASARARGLFAHAQPVLAHARTLPERGKGEAVGPSRPPCGQDALISVPPRPLLRATRGVNHPSPCPGSAAQKFTPHTLEKSLETLSGPRQPARPLPDASPVVGAGGRQLGTRRNSPGTLGGPSRHRLPAGPAPSAVGHQRPRGAPRPRTLARPAGEREAAAGPCTAPPLWPRPTIVILTLNSSRNATLTARPPSSSSRAPPAPAS